MSKPDDAELVAQCKRGNRRAFETLVLRYQKPVFNAALRMLHSTDDASDITQTVFLKVYENLDTFDPAYKLFSWIYRIAMNESINYLASKKRTGPLAVESEIEDESRNPEQQLDGDILRGQLRSALMNITPEYRMVIVLKHYLECSYSEISEVLEISEKTVKSRLYTGRQLLRNQLTTGDLH